MEIFTFLFGNTDGAANLISMLLIAFMISDDCGRIRCILVVAVCGVTVVTFRHWECAVLLKLP